MASRAEPLEDLDRVARLELDDGLLPARTDALDGTAALRLGLHLDDRDVQDLDVEELLDGLADLRLVRILVDLERVAVLRDLAVALLGDHGCDQHLAGMKAHALLPLLLGARLHERERSLADEQRARPDDLGDLDLGRDRDEHALEVAERLDERLLGLGHDEDRRRLLAPVGEQRGGGLRRGGVELRRVEHAERAGLRVVGERAAERGAARPSC